MKISIEEAKRIQIELARKVIIQKLGKIPTIVWGVDVSFLAKDVAVGVIAVLNVPQLQVINIYHAFKEITFPYIPGLLSFRETPVIVEASKKIKDCERADLIFVDGNGILHPRKFGIASHIGLIFDTPTIGVAKSLLCGKIDRLPYNKGQAVEVILNKETVGYCVKTTSNSKPVFVSCGHKITLEEAKEWTLKTSKYRIPEPTRIADIYSKRLKHIDLHRPE
ncbi:MAG: endonuclease V [Planctomycetota bacterium]